ncbi:hypothetical protein AeMF1_009356 [Aphanomyces euteiches]|nr:hypothetical protein AeMF1_009356 [Aphanomyces euteiches]KAH9197832.1 hypothetical protein AeNC1_000199 [Aphanomyces euteiches]
MGGHVNDDSQRGTTTFGKAPRFRQERKAKSNQGKNPATDVLPGIDALVRSVGHLKLPSNPPPAKYNPKYDACMTKGPALSFPRADKATGQRKSTVGPATYNVARADAVVKPRLVGYAWPSSIPQEEKAPAYQLDDSDTESAASSVEEFVKEVLSTVSKTKTRDKRPRKTVGYHTISYALVDRRVSKTPLIEQAERTRSTIIKHRQKGRVSRLSRATLSDERWLQPQVHSTWTQQKSRTKLVAGFGGSAKPRLTTTSSCEWKPSQIHKAWTSERGLAWTHNLGRYHVQCKYKGAKRVKTFAARPTPQSSLGPGTYSLPSLKTPQRGVPFGKASSRAEAVGPFGRRWLPDAALAGLDEDKVDLDIDMKWVKPRTLTARISKPNKENFTKTTNQIELEPLFRATKKRIRGVLHFDKTAPRFEAANGPVQSDLDQW